MTEIAVEMQDNGDGGFGTIMMTQTHHGKDGRGRDSGMEVSQDEEDFLAKYETQESGEIIMECIFVYVKNHT